MQATSIRRRKRASRPVILFVTLLVAAAVIAITVTSLASSSDTPQTPVDKCVTALGNTGTGFADGSLWTSVQMHGGGGQFWSEMDKLPQCTSLSYAERLQVLPAFVKNGNPNG